MLWLPRHTGNMTFSVIINFPLHSCICTFILLVWKMIRGQRSWLKSILLCVGAQVKDMQGGFSLCKLCKPILSNFAICSMKNYTGSALILSMNIWKSTKYVTLLAFPLFTLVLFFLFLWCFTFYWSWMFPSLQKKPSSFMFCHMHFN